MVGGLAINGMIPAFGLAAAGFVDVSRFDYRSDSFLTSWRSPLSFSSAGCGRRSDTRPSEPVALANNWQMPASEGRLDVRNAWLDSAALHFLIGVPPRSARFIGCKLIPMIYSGRTVIERVFNSRSRPYSTLAPHLQIWKMGCRV